MLPPRTLGELKQSGWRSRSVKDELRANLIAKLQAGAQVFPGIVGYDQTVIPRIQDAILSRHDFILLGLRGQAKTRLLRALPSLLDPAVPAVEGCEINCDPLAPICAPCHRRRAELGDALPVTWLAPADRYREKLATPDVTIADLIGDIDPIKAATRKLTFADPEVIHYGIVPRTNRGIFAINELPDLQARIQVGLLNILEEGDVQIRGFPVRLPLDVCMVFSANPEDYTNRGSIITPLRDRIASQILTHYPRTLDEGLAITRQEAWVDRGGVRVHVPDWLRLAVEQVAFEARKSELVDQSSGVSARVTIALLENVHSNAERRALRSGATSAVARVCDCFAGSAAVTGKVELVYEGEREGVEAVTRRLVGAAVKAVFDARFPDAYKEGPEGEGVYAPVLKWFRAGNTIDLSDDLSDADLVDRCARVTGLADVARRFLGADGGLAGAPAADTATALAAAQELVLEGLHQASLLAKQEVIGGHVYRDMLEDMVKSLGD